MRIYRKYIALDRAGNRVEIESSFPYEQVLSDIQKRGLILFKSSISFWKTVQEIIRPSTLSRQDVVFFLSYIKDMFETGINMVQALTLMGDAMPPKIKKKFEKILNSMLDSIHSGDTFANAIKKTGAFPDFVVANITVAEKNGTMEAVIKDLITAYESEISFLKKVKNSMIQPVITLVFAFLLVAGMLFIGIPKMKKFIKQEQLTGLTAAVVRISDLFASNPLFVVVSLVAFIAFLFYLSFSGWLKKIPLVSELIRLKTYTFIFSSLSILQRNGFPVTESVILLGQVFKNSDVRWDRIYTSLRNGEKISDSFGQEMKDYPLVKAYLSIGETTGKMDTYFLSLSKYFKNQLENKLTAIMELMPVFILFFLGGIVTVVLFVAYKLIYGTMASFGR